MIEGRKDANSMLYFPNSCFKLFPPKDYLWKVYATLQPVKFKEGYDQHLDRLLYRIKRPTHLAILDEHKQLMAKRKEENLKLSLALKKCGVSKNLSYLKRAKKIRTVNNTLDDFVKRNENLAQTPYNDQRNDIYEED